jgi:DNA ligase (NAD+)
MAYMMREKMVINKGELLPSTHTETLEWLSRLGLKVNPQRHTVDSIDELMAFVEE